MRYIQTASGVLDCVKGLERHSKATVSNPHAFHVGQDVDVYRDLESKKLGTMKVIEVREKPKELTLACYDGRVTFPAVGDFLVVHSR